MSFLTILLCLIVFVPVVTMAATCFIAGMLFGQAKEPKKAAPAPRKPDGEELRKAKRMQKEMANMLSYNGEEQEEITD